MSIDNSGNWNNGYMNTDRPPVRIFNRETDVSLDDIEFPDYFYFKLTKWIEKDSMTDEEKAAHPFYKTTEGYLKTYGYEEAWRMSWDEASKEDREKTLKLPNFNNELFKEISGIDALAELNKDDVEIVVEGQKKVISRKSAIALGLLNG